MSDYKERVVTEHTELTDKIILLSAFLESDKFDSVEKKQRYFLIVQHAFMIKYAEALSERIVLF